MKFETDIFSLTIHESGLSVICIKNNATFNVSDLVETKRLITGVLGEKKAGILVEAEGIFYTTKEVREKAASPEHSTHHAAVAFYSTKLGHKLLGQLYIKINRPKVPTSYFTIRTDAIEWLNTHLKVNSK